MVKVSFDYRDEYGYLQSMSIVYREMRQAFALLKTLSARKDIIGKPCIERV